MSLKQFLHYLHFAEPIKNNFYPINFVQRILYINKLNITNTKTRNNIKMKIKIPLSLFRTDLKIVDKNAPTMPATRIRNASL